jgi:hypothetical protein
MKTYFYDNKTKTIQRKNSFVVEKYIVYEIEHDGNIDVAERRVKTITSKLNRKLAGGYFSDTALPYNFKKDYTIINVPKNTPIRKYDKADKFIINLIEIES